MKTAPRDFSRILGWINSHPWAMHEPALDAMLNIVETAAQNPSGFVMPDFEGRKDSVGSLIGDSNWEGTDYSFPVVDGIAVISVIGPLTNRADWFSQISGMASYQTIARQLREFKESDLNACILEIDSPGGSVLGLAELADQIYSIRESSQMITSIACPMAASAGYYLACQTDELWATPSAMVGSIGTVMRMVDTDRAYKNAGYDPVTIRSHELKCIGAGAVTPNQQSELQRECMSYFNQFKEAVMRGRGMTEEQVDELATGQVWVGEELLDLGLVDNIGSIEKLVEYLS